MVIEEHVRWQVERQCDWQVRRKVWYQIRERIWDHVWDQVFWKTRVQQVDWQVWSQARGQLEKDYYDE